MTGNPRQGEAIQVSPLLRFGLQGNASLIGVETLFAATIYLANCAQLTIPILAQLLYH
ncbi:MAG: hypothetical protein AB2784_18410 [Candidatus Thiodiazotropha endolucinida]